jgi:hypothetical protein
MEPPDTRRYDSGRELLKWIALTTMTVDHIGLVLYPQIPILRIIGRVSFPLFAYLLVLGMSSTHDSGKYFSRMLYFALLSQLPFAIANDVLIWQHLNIFFTLSLGIILIYFLDRNNILFLAPLIASVVIPVDYGAYGLATILFLYIMRSFRRTGVILFIALNLLLIPFETTYQPLALLALPIIMLHRDGRLAFMNSGEGVKHPLFSKYFFYVYYPAHLLVLALIRTIR